MLDGKSLLDFVSYSLARPVRMSSPNPNAAPNSCELIQSSSHIAKHYLEATTRRLKGSAPFSPETWWVTELTPLILIEHSWAEISSFPKYTRPVAAITEQIDSKISLWYCPVKYMGQQLGLWCLGYDLGANRDVIRRLRIHLLRLHAERECLKQILRYIAINRIDTRSRDQESDSLQLYLTNSIRLLTRASRYGLPQSQILLAAQNADDFVTEGERTNLLTAVERVRRNLYRAVKQFTEHHGPHETIFYNISGNGAVNIGRTIHTGEEHVTKYNIKFGDRTVFHGDFVVANTIQNSFNKIDPSGASPKLKEQLKNLHDNVTEMTQHMEPSKGKEVARDLQSFTEEVTSEAPRQKWYSVSAEGLLDAAKAVGSIAAPVVSTVKTILALLSGAA